MRNSITSFALKARDAGGCCCWRNVQTEEDEGMALKISYSKIESWLNWLNSHCGWTWSFKLTESAVFLPPSHSDFVIPFTKQNSDVILPWYQRREKLTNGTPLNVLSSNDTSASWTVGSNWLDLTHIGCKYYRKPLKMHWNTPVLKLHNALYFF